MRIVFASLGSLGDLHPLLALARECNRRGHATGIAASPCYADYIRTLGFEPALLRPELEPSFAAVEKLGHPRLGPERLLRDVVFPAAAATFEDLCAAAHGADLLVVGELLYVAPLVAATLDIPWVNAILSPTSFLSASDPCVLAPLPGLEIFRNRTKILHRAALAVGRRLTDRWARPLHRLQTRLGLPPVPNPVFEGKHSSHLVLALFPEFFAPPQPDWPPNLTQTGFPFFDQPAGPEPASQIADFLAAGPPPLVFTLGSAMVHIARDFYVQAALASRDLGRRAILLLGENPAPPSLPSGMLAIRYAPLELVVPAAAAVIHHGGIGTCGMVLRHGIPSLVIPFGYDQPDNAHRLQRLGTAAVLPKRRARRKPLAASIRELLDDCGLRRRCAGFSARIHPLQELQAGVDALEAVAAGRIDP